MIDKNKKYRTRDGREVRIYAADGGKEGNRALGCYMSRDNGWTVGSWSAQGIWNTNNFASDYDLIEVRPRIKREVWVNVYPNRMGVPSANKAYVDAHRGKDAIACVRLTIDCEEGEGL